jgi:hypothetical protein
VTRRSSLIVRLHDGDESRCRRKACARAISTAGSLLKNVGSFYQGSRAIEPQDSHTIEQT